MIANRCKETLLCNKLHLKGTANVCLSRVGGRYKGVPALTYTRCALLFFIKQKDYMYSVYGGVLPPMEDI